MKGKYAAMRSQMSFRTPFFFTHRCDSMRYVLCWLLLGLVLLFEMPEVSVGRDLQYL